MSSDRRIAVLCVHGIQGNPDQFCWIESALPGAQCFIVPGCGHYLYTSSGRDMILRSIRTLPDQI